MRNIVLACLAVILCGVMAVVIAGGQAWMVDRDWFTYWGGGHGVLTGANVYDPATWLAITYDNGSTWLPNPVFIYAPPTGIFFAPLATLPVGFSAVVWVWLSEIFVVLSVFVIARAMHWKQFATFAPFLFFGVFFFLPVLLTLLMGQVSALLLILVVVAAVLWDRGEWLAGGLLFGITIVKPQPVAFLLPMLALWALLNRRWNALLGLALSLGTSATASLVLYPRFVPDWQAAVSNKVGGVAVRMPTVWGITADVFGASPAATAIALVLIVLTTLVCVWLVARWHGSVLELTGLLLIAALIVTPYLWNYDQILLLVPLIIALIRLEQRGFGFWRIVLGLYMFDGLAMVLLVIASVRLADTFSIALPLLVGAFLAGGTELGRSVYCHANKRVLE